MREADGKENEDETFTKVEAAVKKIIDFYCLENVHMTDLVEEEVKPEWKSFQRKSGRRSSVKIPGKPRDEFTMIGGVSRRKV